MNCPRCSTEYPGAARFCASCGADVRTTGEGSAHRRGAYAAHPGEPVTSFNIVTSLMPLASGSTPQTYKFALGIGLLLPIVFAAVGLLPLALACAAFVVPVVYVLYLYDVNQWEDEPVPVVLGTVLLAAALGAVFTLLWRDGILGGALAFVGRGRSAHVDAKSLIVIGLLVPIVGEILKQIGPLWLSTRTRFDDLLDAVTFGVASGAAFAAAETIVLHHDVILGGTSRFEHVNAALWISLVVTTGLLKPVIYGAATGIALAGFSGLGSGYDGFKSGYWRGLAEAVGVNIAFQLGLYFAGLLGGTLGVMLGLIWALVIAVAVVIRLRFVLHTALLEGALEHAAVRSIPPTASRDIGFCSECELPLLHEASFCIACGTSVRAASKLTRRANSLPTTARQEVQA
ncbi:MAG: hypothetical protein QOH79_937 [Acidimicrobiaceae bacterium]